MPPVWIVLALLPILGGAERFNCRGRILGAYYADAKSGCKAFHVCVRVAGGGVRDFRFFCPPGTLFHQEAQTCTDWGDDDPLACPADLYDGQFDLYKIGSGFDTKKVSSPGNRDDEAEFGLQRAESGDRRLNNAPASDLRAAHSSDFFSGQRDRGRDDAPAPPSSSRQSFRRNPTTRAPPTTQYVNTSPQTQNSNPPQYEQKRKLVRKRPIYTKTTNYAQNAPPQKTSQQQNYPQQFLQKQSYTQSPAPAQSTPQQPFQQSTPPQPYQNPQQSFQNKPSPQQPFQQATPPQPYQKPQQNFQNRPTPQQSFQNQPSSQQNYDQFNEKQQYRQQSNPKTSTQQTPPTQNFQQQPNPPQLLQQTFNQRTHEQNRVIPPSPPAIVPPEYKDEYVEVSRVTPKKSRYFASPTTAQYSASTVTPNFNKKDGLVELYNYESQSTPGVNTQKDIRPFKVRNSFNVADIPLQNEQDFARTNVNIQPNGASRASPTTLDYNTASSRSYPTTTPAYKNFNSVSYDSDKSFGVSNSKQNYYSSQSSTSKQYTTTTQRSAPPANLNTVAYNTNNGFNNIQSANYVGNDDDDDDNDDGQYRPPHGEDDGQYRPELYERELLSGAHSLNIAASGNRLPEDQKQKARAYQKPVVAQTAAPRPFRPAPTETAAPTTARAPETTFTTTYRPTQASTKVTFDVFQTYTTTSRPETPPPPPPPRVLLGPTARPTPPAPSSKPPAPRPPHTSVAKPSISNKEDASYDYAYYDSDSGFTEYDQIQEFGKTKKA